MVGHHSMHFSPRLVVNIMWIDLALIFEIYLWSNIRRICSCYIENDGIDSRLGQKKKKVTCTFYRKRTECEDIKTVSVSIASDPILRSISFEKWTLFYGYKNNVALKHVGYTMENTKDLALWTFVFFIGKRKWRDIL